MLSFAGEVASWVIDIVFFCRPKTKKARKLVSTSGLLAMIKSYAEPQPKRWVHGPLSMIFVVLFFMLW